MTIAAPPASARVAPTMSKFVPLAWVHATPIVLLTTAGKPVM
jgi:hypothetical protein